MNKKEELLKYCRYYHGEKEPPNSFNQDEQTFWNYERAWIEFSTSKDKETSQFVSDMLSDYVDNGLAQFCVTDNTPVTLKALLFNRYRHWMSEDIEAFKKFYQETYYHD